MSIGSLYLLTLFLPVRLFLPCRLSQTKAAYEVNGVVGTSNDGVPDLNAAAMWGYFGSEVEKDEDMYF